MKNLILCILATMVFAACSGNRSVDANESEIASKIEKCSNADSLKIYVAQAKDYVQTLIDEGKVEEAKIYLDKIEPVVSKYAPALSSSLASLKATMGKVSDKAVNAADSMDAKQS